MKRNVFFGLAGLWLVACDGNTGTDAGPMPDSSIADSGDDDAGSDSGPPDAGPVLCGGVMCGADETCVRDVCLATCGADLSGWDAALAADLTPVFTFCRNAGAFGTEIDATGTIVREVSAMASADGTDLTLAEWRMDPSAGQPTPADIATASVAHDAAVMLFLGGYVVRGATGHLFGYTLSSADFAGGVIHIASDGTPTELIAFGNFDADVLADDTFLVNGLSLASTTETGQAAYSLDAAASNATRQVVTGLGDSSGGVAVGADFVLLGGLDASFGSHVYAASRTAVEAAVAGGAPVTDPIEVLYGGAPLPSAFSIIGGRIVTPRYNASFALEALQAHPIGTYSSDTGLSVDAPLDMSTGPTFSGAYAADGDRVLLRFSEGLLLVE